MKILNINFKNLNSLRGEWRIDLSSGSYVSDGIFAITGPTGAGKTTIFDAICLALYAQTPRLGKITGASNEIMSKHTNDCYAEIIFETHRKKYKSSWNQHKDSKGRLQSIRHLISDLDSGSIISEAAKEIPGIVEDITGMDFKRFTQAVMLEQGKFDAFLRAKESERSQILETLTGTEIYGVISTMVYERTAKEEVKLKKIQDELHDKKPHDNFGSEEEISRTLTEKQNLLSQVEAKQKKRKEFLDWLKNIQKLENELAQNDESILQFKKRIDMFTRDRRRFDEAQRANELSAEYASLKAKREQLQTSRKRREAIAQKISQENSEFIKIVNASLPDMTAKLNRLVKNITEPPDITYAKGKERIIQYRNIVKNKIETVNRKKQAEDYMKRTREAFKSIEAEYNTCLHHYEEIVLSGAREKLRPGEPCPVCGSREHPGIARIDKKINSQSVTANFEELSRKLNEAQSEYTRAIARLEQCIKDISTSEEQAAETRAKVLEVIEPMGIFEAGIKNCSEILARVENWGNNVKILNENINTLAQRRDKLSASIKTLSETLQSDSANFDASVRELEKLEADFQARLVEKGFDCEESFAASRIDDGEFAKLQRQTKYLDDELARLLTIKTERTERLNIEKAKSLTTLTIDELTRALQEQDGKILQKNIYELEHALAERKNIRSEIERITAELEVQKILYSNWATLNSLIGQKNGGKFRVFAQRVTLEMMIGFANRQLERMSGRYKLITTPDDDGLALSVIDSEQANEIRPTKNLSGGESFIVSLALALGLSQISGSKARVDSLFLDEGFGSLDEETLNTALDALAEVRREGRIIGIISHVQALKERIAAQINVIPKSEGVSILEGPGCHRL